MDIVKNSNPSHASTSISSSTKSLEDLTRDHMLGWRCTDNWWVKRSTRYARTILMRINTRIAEIIRMKHAANVRIAEIIRMKHAAKVK